MTMTRELSRFGAHARYNILHDGAFVEMARDVWDQISEFKRREIKATDIFTDADGWDDIVVEFGRFWCALRGLNFTSGWSHDLVASPFRYPPTTH